MRGHGSLQQMLGKKVTGAKRREPRAGTPSLDQAEQKRHKTANQGGAAGAAQGHSTGQQKLSSFFTAKPRQQPPPASKKRAVTGSNQVKEPAEDIEAAAAAPASIPEQPHFTVYTRIVGRQHQEAVAEQQPPCKGEELLLLREPNNAVDPCAILVCSRTRAGGMRPHGHLPASVASHLASLLDSAQVEATAELADEAAAAAADASSSGELPPFEGAAAAADSSSSSLARTGSGSIRWRLKLTIRLAGCTTSSAAAAAAGPVAAVTAALEAAAAAGIQSLEPGRNNGAVLSASFEHILQQARQYDLHLLDTQEQAVLASMQALPPPAKCLLMRLLLRKRTWFALDALAYPDVPDTAAAAAQLSGSGLLCYSHEPGADLAGLLPQLPAAVLKQLLALLLPRNHPGMAAARARSGAAAAGGQEGQTAKAAMLASIQLCCQSAAGWARLQGALSSVAGVWLAVLPEVAATFARLQHLYFLTPGQDLGMFLAVDRGVLRYPPYCVSRQRPVFASRAALLGYEEALALAGRVEAALEDGDNAAAWQLLQPALAALRAGSHKAVAWQEEQGATMPNPPPAQSAPQQPAPQQHAPQQHRHLHLRTHLTPQQQQQQQQQQALDELRTPSPRPAYSGIFHPSPSAAASRSRSRSPSPSSNSPGSSSGSDSDDAASGSSARRVARGSSVRWGSSASSSTSSSSARTGTSAHVTTSTTAATAAQAESKHNAQAEQAAVDQEQHENISQQQQQSSAVAARTGTTVAGSAGSVAIIPGLPSSSSAAAAAAAAAGQAAAVLPPLWLARFSAGWVHASLGTVAVSLLEKQKRWGEAVELLRLLLGGNGCVARRGDWWERLAINLEHQGLAEQALEAVESSLADAWVRWGDRLGLQRRLLRLAKPPRRWRRPAWAPQAEWEPPEVAITGRPLNCTVGLKSRFYGLDGSQVTVEALALQHYASAEGGGWQGLHCEGGVWATLFGLLLWDVIFASVPDVLRSPFQVAPLDLGSECFYSARRDALDRQLSRIADGEAGAILSATWAAHSGQMCRGVNWQRFEQALLLDIVECVGGLGLAAVLRLMAEDHSGAAGGLPDLLLWRPADRCAKAVEVKGPRDRLSHQQRFWLAAMADSGMAVEVLKELPAGSREPQVLLHTWLFVAGSGMGGGAESAGAGRNQQEQAVRVRCALCFKPRLHFWQGRGREAGASQQQQQQQGQVGRQAVWELLPSHQR
uniref:Fanconi-associated nuclease n=1 Tax=Tetradesmus obliquus TaxID=3088 RepID=A0A383VBR8_TETOB